MLLPPTMLLFLVFMDIINLSEKTKGIIVNPHDLDGNVVGQPFFTLVEVHYFTVYVNKLVE